jgi:hypothetical protein
MKSLRGERGHRLRSDARALRAKHGLCQHSDDERAYPNDEAAAADTAPMKKCEICGRSQLIVKAVSGAFAKKLEAPAELVVKNLLR